MIALHSKLSLSVARGGKPCTLKRSAIMWSGLQFARGVNGEFQIHQEIFLERMA